MPIIAAGSALNCEGRETIFTNRTVYLRRDTLSVTRKENSEKKTLDAQREREKRSVFMVWKPARRKSIKTQAGK